MALAKPKVKLAVEAYLAGEETSQVRYEYLHGEVYAMAGVSQNHNRITGNLLIAISGLLPDGCETYSENIKVRPEDDVFYYPDLIVTCEGDFANKYICESPVLIIEIVSPSTARTDRREKLAAYQAMPSVREIVLVDQERIGVEVHRRCDQAWEILVFDEHNDTIELTSLGTQISMAEIYRRVRFGPVAV